MMKSTFTCRLSRSLLGLLVFQLLILARPAAAQPSLYVSAVQLERQEVFCVVETATQGMAPVVGEFAVGLHKYVVSFKLKEDATLSLTSIVELPASAHNLHWVLAVDQGRMLGIGPTVTRADLPQGKYPKSGLHLYRFDPKTTQWRLVRKWDSSPFIAAHDASTIVLQTAKDVEGYDLTGPEPRALKPSAELSAVFMNAGWTWLENVPPDAQDGIPEFLGLTDQLDYAATGYAGCAYLGIFEHATGKKRPLAASVQVPGIAGAMRVMKVRKSDEWQVLCRQITANPPRNLAILTEAGKVVASAVNASAFRGSGDLSWDIRGQAVLFTDVPSMLDGSKWTYTLWQYGKNKEPTTKTIDLAEHFVVSGKSWVPKKR